MPKPRYLSTVVLTIAHDAPILDMTDLVAGRAYSMDHVTDVTATMVGAVVQDGPATWTHVPPPRPRTHG